MHKLNNRDVARISSCVYDSSDIGFHIITWYKDTRLLKPNLLWQYIRWAKRSFSDSVSGIRAIKWGRYATFPPWRRCKTASS